jgi:hypothetical protein
VGPFERHVREAISVNRARAPVYAALSGGRSRVISEPLIAVERLIGPLARAFDRRAIPYHEAGVPLLELAFVPMDGLPPAERVTPPALAPDRDERARGAMNSAIRRSVDRAALLDLLPLLDRALECLTSESVDALRRHLLESIRRLATIAAPMERLAAAASLPSPEHELRALARWHGRALPLGDHLDDLARPLQRCGIPILVHDLPRIPAWPDGLLR